MLTELETEPGRPAPTVRERLDPYASPAWARVFHAALGNAPKPQPTDAVRWAMHAAALSTSTRLAEDEAPPG